MITDWVRTLLFAFIAARPSHSDSGTRRWRQELRHVINILGQTAVGKVPKTVSTGATPGSLEEWMSSPRRQNYHNPTQGQSRRDSRTSVITQVPGVERPFLPLHKVLRLAVVWQTQHLVTYIPSNTSNIDPYTLSFLFSTPASTFRLLDLGALVT